MIVIVIARIALRVGRDSETLQLAMTDVKHHRSSKHKKRHREDDHESKSKKHSRHDKDRESKKKNKSEKSKKVRVIDDDADEDVWIEKNIDMDGENVSVQCISLVVHFS